MGFKYKLQLGVALIQVLLLSAILAMMALQFTLSSRQQVKQAITFKDKIEAEVELRTVINRVLLALISLPKSGEKKYLQQQDTIGRVWNFHGTSFTVGQYTEVSIQDINGQISIYGITNREMLTQLLLSLGQNDAQAATIIDNLVFWQGKGRGLNTSFTSESVRKNYLINKTELKHILGIDTVLYQQLAPLVTSYPNTYFNPLTAPAPILKSMLSGDTYNEINSLRSAGTLTAERYLELKPGFDDDDMILVPGRRFEVRFSVKKGHAVAKRTLIWYIRPQSKVPVVWLQ